MYESTGASQEVLLVSKKRYRPLDDERFTEALSICHSIFQALSFLVCLVAFLAGSVFIAGNSLVAVLILSFAIIVNLFLVWAQTNISEILYKDAKEKCSTLNKS